MSNPVQAVQKQVRGGSGADWLLDFDAGPLETFLIRTLPRFRGPLSVHPARPESRSTFTLSTPDMRFIMRRSESRAAAAALEREFRILAALSQRAFPVPRPLLYCDNEKFAGAAFFVTEFVEAQSFSDPIMPGAAPAFRAKAYDALNATLAQLHSLDPRVLGIAPLGNGRNYVADQVERSIRSYRAAGLDKVPEMDRLIAWLPANLPPDRPARLVHGDFRLDNILFSTEEPKVLAVLDWHLAGLGDPIADAVYHFMAWIMLSGVGEGHTLSEHELADLGIPTLETYAGTYAHRTGLRTIPNFETYFAYNLFRMTVLQAVAARRSSAAARERAHQNLRPLAALAWAFARRAGAE